MGYAKSLETKQKLISTTSKLLRTQGYAATGVKQILEESGVPKGSLYHHFPNGKTELAAEAVMFSNRFLTGQLEKLLAESGNVVSAFEAFCNYYIFSLIGTDYQKGCPIATITLEAAASVEPIQQACDQGYEMMCAVFEDRLVLEGVARQTAKTLVVLAVSAVEGALILCRAHHNTQPLASVRDTMAQQMRQAINEHQA